MRISSLSIRALALAVGLAAAASLSVVTAQAAPPGGAASGDVGSSGIALNEDAREAGRQANGAGFTEQQALEAYWTPERMRTAVSADSDPGFQRSATKTRSRTWRVGVASR